MRGRCTISESVRSASLRLAATRSLSDRAAIPANWSPDFSSLALAKSSRRSEKTNRSGIGFAVNLDFNHSKLASIPHQEKPRAAWVESNSANELLLLE